MFICKVVNFELPPTLEMMWGNCHVHNLKASGFSDYIKPISYYLINVKFIIPCNKAVGSFLFSQHASSTHNLECIKLLNPSPPHLLAAHCALDQDVLCLPALGWWEAEPSSHQASASMHVLTPICVLESSFSQLHAWVCPFIALNRSNAVEFQLILVLLPAC